METPQFETILDSLDEGVLTLSDAGKVIGLNRAACEILEVTKQEAVQRTCPFLLGDETCAQSSHIRQSIAMRQPIRGVEVQIETPSGRQKVLDIRTNVLRHADDSARDGGGGLIVFRDVTELARLRRDLGERYRLGNIIGKSKPMQAVFELIEQVADADASVLIEGETGTGKELVARAIHQLSPRAAKPFVAVNCSALPEALLESELFGHERGSFTGAVRDKRGRFEAADGGTIFLDEIGDVSPAMQVKLLRVLQERTFERVGGERSITVDLRVISATNRSLGELVARREFRQDLLYRLRVVPIELPPLRARRDDIPLLAQHFVERFREHTGRPIEGVAEPAVARLIDYPWPGNVRELENVIEYAFVKARDGAITLAHLPPELLDTAVAPISSAGAAVPHGSSASAAHIEQTLRDAGWNVSKAARLLGMSRTTLYKRMRTFELTPPAE